MALREEDWKFMDYMLDNSILVKEDNVELICVPPSPISDMKYCYKFHKLNGAFYSVDFWDYVKAIGEKL